MAQLAVKLTKGYSGQGASELTNEELQRFGQYAAKSILTFDESQDFERLAQLDEVMPIKRGGRGKTRSRNRKNIFALKTNPQRLRRLTKATEKLMMARRLIR